MFRCDGTDVDLEDDDVEILPADSSDSGDDEDEDDDELEDDEEDED